MIRLTSKLGYPVLVNFDHIRDVSICELKDKCDFEANAQGEFQSLGLRLEYSDGKIRIIQDCLSDLNQLVDITGYMKKPHENIEEMEPITRHTKKYF